MSLLLLQIHVRKGNVRIKGLSTLALGLSLFAIVTTALPS